MSLVEVVDGNPLHLRILTAERVHDVAFLTDGVEVGR